MMIDRPARDVATRLLLQLMDGVITNDEYERRFPRDVGDRAVQAAYTQSWLSYSDLKEHTLTGKHALADDGRALFERCILFLKTDREFEWPPARIGLRYALIRLSGFGRLLSRRVKKDMNIGDTEVWPFPKRADYEEARRRHGGSRSG